MLAATMRLILPLRLAVLMALGDGLPATLQENTRVLFLPRLQPATDKAKAGSAEFCVPRTLPTPCRSARAALPLVCDAVPLGPSTDAPPAPLPEPLLAQRPGQLVVDTADARRLPCTVLETSPLHLRQAYLVRVFDLMCGCRFGTQIPQAPYEPAASDLRPQKRAICLHDCLPLPDFQKQVLSLQNMLDLRSVKQQTEDWLAADLTHLLRSSHVPVALKAGISEVPVWWQGARAEPIQAFLIFTDGSASPGTEADKHLTCCAWSFRFGSSLPLARITMAMPVTRRCRPPPPTMLQSNMTLLLLRNSLRSAGRLFGLWTSPARMKLLLRYAITVRRQVMEPLAQPCSRIAAPYMHPPKRLPAHFLS